MKLRHNCEKMIEVMKACHQEVEVTDMTNISVPQRSTIISRGISERRAMASMGIAMGSAAPRTSKMRGAMMESYEDDMDDGMMMMSASKSISASKGSYMKKAAP